MITLGLDASTQSLSALIIDTSKGTIIADHSVSFGRDLAKYKSPAGFIPGGKDGEIHADPRMWLDALDMLMAKLQSSGIDVSTIDAVSGSGQQHATVYLAEKFHQTISQLDSSQNLSSQLDDCFSRQTSPIWMDNSTAKECAEMADAIGSQQEVCKRTGSIMIERFSAAQIRRFAKLDPAGWQNTNTVHLCSSFLASVISGKSVAIDHGDGAGMNLMNLQSLSWDDKVVSACAPELAEKLPSLAPSATVAGNIAPYFVEKYGFKAECKSILWTGDNPSSLVGMGAAGAGKMVISLGTSDTLFAAMPEPVTDPDGYGHVFGNPLGGYMSLICFRNGSLAREALKELLAASWEDFAAAGKAERMGPDGFSAPFFMEEITPLTRAPHTQCYGDVDEEKLSKLEKIRFLLDGQFINMKYRAAWLGIDPDEIYLTGGAAQNDGIAQTVADIFQIQSSRLQVNNSAALGASLRAAHACGISIQSLESDFCKSSAGSERSPQTISPESQLKSKQLYQSLINNIKQD